MKLEDAMSQQQHQKQQSGEINLADLRNAIEGESPSSFNKSMDFARHTKRHPSLRIPPSRDCSTCSSDMLGSSFASTSFMGESFMGESFADGSFALNMDDHDDDGGAAATAPRGGKRPDLETVLDLEGDEDGQNSSKDLSTDAEVDKTE